VGGTVRDLIRRRSFRDLDFTVEGDAAALARLWAGREGFRAGAQSEFGTIAVETPAGRIDFAPSRGERYSHPAALPEVFPAPIETDMLRRDFSVNAMAYCLVGPRKGKLLDPAAGRRDITSGLLRMLHPDSALDDPTRAYRAARYTVRLGFAVERRTRGWISAARAAGAFDRLSGDRRRREISRILEQRPWEGIQALEGLGLIETILPALSAGRSTARRFEKAAAALRRLVRERRSTGALFVWAADLDGPALCALSRRLALPPPDSGALERLAAHRESAPRLARRPASEIAASVESWSEETLIAVTSVLRRSEAQPLARERSRARRLRLSIAGRDLLAAGMAPGPAVGRALDRTRAARLDREIDRSQELAYALLQARQ
jgi:tRNA nucleotidyltransferase (CCA-adding enzyme)